MEALPFRLQPWSPADVPAVQEASGDPLISLITTVPASGTESAALAIIERQHRRLSGGLRILFRDRRSNVQQCRGPNRVRQDAGGERKDMYVYSRLRLCP